MALGCEWGGYFVIPLGGMGLLVPGWKTDNLATKKLGYEVIQSVAYAQVVSGVIKTVTGRARPGTKSADSGIYRPFSLHKSSYNSFPAGTSRRLSRFPRCSPGPRSRPT